MPFNSEPAIPSTAPPTGLTDAELDELDTLLGQTPEPLEPLDLVMLDGYLCGVIVQPTLHDAVEWLPRVYDVEGRPLPEGTDEAWRERTTALVVKRYQALNRELAEDGSFEPVIALDEPPDADDARDDEACDDEDDESDDFSEVSRPLAPWVSGFLLACEAFPALIDRDDDEVQVAFAHIWRHAPAHTDDDREFVAEMAREVPLDSVDDAIDDLVGAVATLDELTREERYRVETVRRDAPKPGRNDPCPCGSGRKYKQCCGAVAP